MRQPNRLSRRPDLAGRWFPAAAFLALLATTAAGQQPPIVPDPANHPGKQMCELATAAEVQGCGWNACGNGYAAWQRRTTPQEAERCRQACVACCEAHDGIPDISRFLTSTACECGVAALTGGANAVNCGGPALVGLLEGFGVLDERAADIGRALVDGVDGLHDLWRHFGLLNRLEDGANAMGPIQRIRRADGISSYYFLGEDGSMRQLFGAEIFEAQARWVEQWFAWARPIGLSGLGVLENVLDLCEAMHEFADENIYREGCRRQCNTIYQGKRRPRPEPEPPPDLGDERSDRSRRRNVLIDSPNPGGRGAGGGRKQPIPYIFYTREHFTPCTDPNTGKVLEDCPRSN
jgi:hypothetical protein